jgi:hypothetical protein
MKLKLPELKPDTAMVAFVALVAIAGIVWICRPQPEIRIIIEDWGKRTVQGGVK